MLRGAQIMLSALVIADCIAFMPASPSARDPVLQVRLSHNSPAEWLSPTTLTVQEGVATPCLRQCTMPCITLLHKNPSLIALPDSRL